jgi:hypothetical protein
VGFATCTDSGGEPKGRMRFCLTTGQNPALCGVLGNRGPAARGWTQGSNRAISKGQKVLTFRPTAVSGKAVPDPLSLGPLDRIRRIVDLLEPRRGTPRSRC